jgi:heterotetrameric sarcosine oxidase gamma subunit
VAEPVARSSIRPTPPVKIEHGWEVNDHHSHANLTVTDCTPLSKVLVRAPQDGPVARALGVNLGGAVRDEHGTLVVGSGPGEWTLIGAPGSAPDVIERIEAISGDEFASVLEVTHGRALIRVSGAQSPDLLSKVCAINLSEEFTPNGAAFRSSVAKVVTDVVRDDKDGNRSYLLHSERSYGQYLFDALLDAGHEFGIETSGFRIDDARSS